MRSLRCLFIMFLSCTLQRASSKSRASMKLQSCIFLLCGVDEFRLLELSGRKWWFQVRLSDSFP